ncbi:hypothetical protein [Acidovorax sp.]|uniref:hypothetical protein n=1 Tax=Acidovorax sp. TaxID=1872122 RepID=UPI003D05BD7B
MFSRTPRKPVARSAAVLALLALPLLASAHTLDVPMGDAAGTTHHLGVICSNEGGYDSDHLVMNIRNNTPGAPLLNAQIIKGPVAVSTTDAVSGDLQPSPSVRVRGGNGVYNLLVNKTGPGALVYTLTIHCMEATGQIHTGTDGVVYQYE